MNLLITQMVSLVTHYNSYITTGSIPRDYLENPVFDHCETVGFILIRNFVNRNHLNGEIVGANPVRWFKYLEKEGCLKLSLHYSSQRDNEKDGEQVSPYINGTLHIEAVYKTYSNFWQFRCFPRTQSADKSILDVRYYLPFRFEDTVNELVNLNAAARQLKEVLNKCIMFTMDNDFLAWSQLCSLSSRVLESSNPESVFPEMLMMNNERYPLKARQAICSTLLVFMSPEEDLWNIKYKKEEDGIMLAKLRDEFFEALINALIAAINAPT
jgi:hypothetical protein